MLYRSAAERSVRARTLNWSDGVVSVDAESATATERLPELDREPTSEDGPQPCRQQIGKIDLRRNRQGRRAAMPMRKDACAAGTPACARPRRRHAAKLKSLERAGEGDAWGVTRCANGSFLAVAASVRSRPSRRATPSRHRRAVRRQRQPLIQIYEHGPSLLMDDKVISDKQVLSVRCRTRPT